MQKIKETLIKIKNNSKKIKSRMSKYIRILKDYVHKHLNQFTETDAEFLFIGNTKTPGLLNYTGTSAKFSGGLKNSALTTLAFIKELLEISSTSVFKDVFFNLDGNNYQKLKLGVHMAESEENKLVSLAICRYIKVK